MKLPTNAGIITAQLLRSAVSLQISVYAFKDAIVDDKVAMEGIEKAVKEINYMARALKNTF